MPSIRKIFPILFLVIGSITFSCSGGGGCEQIEPAPAPLPPSQTVENGMQVRITSDGFNTIKEILPQFIEGELGHLGFIPNFWVGDSNHNYGIDFCPLECGMDISNVDLIFSVKDNVDDSNNIEQCRDGVFAETACDEIWVDVAANIYIGFDIDIFAAGNNITNDCEVDIGFHNQAFEGTVALGLRTRPSDGQMRMDINSITNIDLSGLGISLENCIPILEDFLNALILDNIGQYIELVQAFVGDALVDWIANNLIIPLLQPTIDNIIPEAGTDGQINLGSLMAESGIKGLESFLEMKMFTGGHIDIKNGGITSGIITGFNSDADPETREETTDEWGVAAHSENAKCVPPIQTFDFAQSGLSTVSGVAGASNDRQKTFTRPVLTEYDGTMDQAYLTFEDDSPADVSIALTTEMLDLAGFHMVNSGALCLTYGTEQSDMVKVGMFAILIPSLAEIIDRRVGDAPLKLVLRPQKPIKFMVGQGTEESALLDTYLQDFRIDLYPYVNGRYARALTLALDMHLQMDLMQEVNEEGNLTVMPVLRSAGTENISAQVFNSDLIREEPSEIEDIFPSVVDMIMPMLTSALQPFPMPTYEITKLNSQGDYLTWRIVKMDKLSFKPSVSNDAVLINASLVSVPPGSKKKLELPKAEFSASLAQVNNYEPERLRATLKGQDNAVPKIKIKLDPARDDREYEYQYSLNGGLYSNFQDTNLLEIAKPALFMQGIHTVRIRSRFKNDPYSLTKEPVVLKVTMDSVAPKIAPMVIDGKLQLNAYDYVSKHNVEASFKQPDQTWSSWDHDSEKSISYLETISDEHGYFEVRLRDEAGNISQYSIDSAKLFTVNSTSTNDSGFGCQTSKSNNNTIPFFLVLGIAGLFFQFKRKRFLILPLLMLGTVAFLSCADGSGSKENNDEVVCLDDNDCAGVSCPSNEFAVCLEGQCQCVNDVPWGISGSHSSLALMGQHVWVSSYNMTHGDLMISKVIPKNNDYVVIRPHDWNFIDGVPDGPVVLEQSEVRNGIMAKGQDVGEYTSIGRLNTQTPIIAHHNYDNGALRITLTLDGTDWLSYDMDDGGDPSGQEFGNAGLFNDLHIRESDGFPAVSYMVNNLTSPNGSSLMSEIRFAQATTDQPTAFTDWDIQVVDSVEYPYPEDDEPLSDWPEGNGLFLTHDRFADGRIALSWYDQYSGSLKFSYQTETDGSFSEPVEIATKDEFDRPLGLFASFDIDKEDENQVHFLYQDNMQHTLRYQLYNLDTSDGSELILDDGFRTEDGTNNEGLPMPVQHYFGADANIITTGPKLYACWQDATTQELYFAEYDSSEADPQWEINVLRGNEDPYEGSMGFYTDMEIQGSKLYLSYYGVNLHAESDVFGNPPLYYFVEIFVIDTGIVE
ncbi:MAG: hypothetical protein ACQES9_12435 [Myxococcota bacterium]